MGLAILILGLAVFLGSHVFVTFRDERERLIARLGRNGYRGLFSFVALIGFVLIIKGYSDYRAHEWMQVWTPPAFMKHITIGLMLLAVIFITTSFVPTHIRAWIKHPMVTSVKTWALAHLLSNGDLGSIILFGAFLMWGGYARVAAKRRGDRGFTTQPVGWTKDIVVVVVGVIIFLLLGYYFHPYVIGVPVFGH
jgi:uncharacterized membrane protein